MIITSTTLEMALRFEKIVADIFRYYNYTIIESSDYYNCNINSFDLLVQSPENKKYAIEINTIETWHNESIYIIRTVKTACREVNSALKCDS